jgi:hypothetical protein
VPQETRVEIACEGCMTGCLKRPGFLILSETRVRYEMGGPRVGDEGAWVAGA